MTQPQFEIIKRYILNKIEKGVWRAGDAVPSENQLAERFSVSRMTSRRALTELTDASVLERIRGAGTFVAEQLPTGSLLEIRSIASEIIERGHAHSAEVVSLKAYRVDEAVQRLLALPLGSECWFSRVLHYENAVPIQLEERYVNPLLVPEYLEQDFSAVTPSAYLSQVTPLSQADHWVEATLFDDDICRLLKTEMSQPCLKISRRTYTQKVIGRKKGPHIVNFAYLFHPGDRYRLGGHLDFY